MGFFDLFAHRPQSYHWSASQGCMVKCANTPCRLHSSDVICSSMEEAETAHRQAVDEAERRAREECSAGQSCGMSGAARRSDNGGFSDEVLLSVDPDKDRALRMLTNWRDQKIIVWNPIRICGRHYMIATNGLAGACRRCKGSGIDPERKLKSGKPTECIYCSGKGYSTIYGGPSHSVVTDVKPMDDEERRFQEFVRGHGKEFDRFIRRVGISGSYMSDPALDDTYGTWRKSDIGPMMASRPDEALNLMRSLSDRYANEEAEWKRMEEADANDPAASYHGGLPVIRGPVKAKYPVGGEPTCIGTIMETHDYKGKDGRDMSSYVIYSDGRFDGDGQEEGGRPDAWVALVFDDAGLGPGDEVKVTGRITKLDVDKRGMVREMMIPTKMHVTRTGV